jgi:hypothetical protein
MLHQDYAAASHALVQTLRELSRLVDDRRT